MNIPNLLSVSRILLAIIFLLFLDSPTLSLVIFMIAALTDYFDGYLARKWNQQTELGKILDPLADKILVLIAISAIFIKYDFPYWYFLILIRDVNNLLVLPLLAKIKKSEVKLPMSATLLGKLTTVFQKLTIIFLLLNYHPSTFVMITIVIGFIAAVDYNRRI